MNDVLTEAVLNSLLRDNIFVTGFCGQFMTLDIHDVLFTQNLHFFLLMKFGSVILFAGLFPHMKTVLSLNFKYSPGPPVLTSFTISLCYVISTSFRAQSVIIWLLFYNVCGVSIRI
jgi:hypothetical protein